MKKRINVIIKIFILFLIIFLYLLVPVFIYSDSIVYYNNTKILLGLAKFSSWDIVRGPTLELVLFPFLKLFGNSEFSIRLCTCLFYLIMLVLTYDLCINDKKNKKLYIVLYLILIVFNPVLFGYYHWLLTEFVATTYAVISVYVSIYFLKTCYNKKNTIYMIIFYSFSFLFVWFLKQPYFMIVFIPCLISAILKINCKKNIVNALYVIFVPSIILACGIFSWRIFCIHNGVDYDNGRNNSFFLSTGVIYSNSNIRPQFTNSYYNLDYVKNTKLITEDIRQKLIQKLENGNTNYWIYYVYDTKGNYKDMVLFEYDDKLPKINESIKFALNNIVKYPIISIDSYLSNYLTCINIYIPIKTFNFIYPYKEITDKSDENKTLALQYLNKKNNNLRWNSDMFNGISNLKIDYKYTGNTFVNTLADFHLNLFKALYLLLPFIWLISLLQVIHNKDKYKYVFMIFSTVFIHILSHVFTGGLIDRYVYITFPIYACAIINWINILINNRRKKCEH